MGTGLWASIHDLEEEGGGGGLNGGREEDEEKNTCITTNGSLHHSTITQSLKKNATLRGSATSGGSAHTRSS